jgi:DNA-binding SARP family transcriptional activator
VEFRLLGPLEVRDHGRVLELGGQKRRALLALLLLHANEVVSSDRLIEELWGEEPPRAAATALHGHVSRLRKLLGGDGSSEQLLVTRPPGYMLHLQPEQLDLHRFERLRGEARAARVKGDLVGASGALQAALSLWRGPPLGGLVYERFAQTEVNRLEELRLATIEERIEIDLALGRHTDLISELEHLVSEHRFREGFRGQLMVALYRSGRQAEALQVYQRARVALVEELGIEPGQPLRELQQAILRQDESLDAPREPALPQANDGGKQDAAPPAHPSPRPKATRRRLALPLAVACAIGGAVALGLLLPRVFEESKAHAAYRSGTVLVDLKTRKQIGFVPPSQLEMPGFPVYSGGHFWLMNLTTSTFVEIDPKTGRVLHQFPLPRGARDTPFAIAGHTLWTSAGDDLVKVDTTLGQEIDRLHLDKIVGTKGSAEGVAVGGGLVWVGRDVGLGQVVAIDPHTRKVRYRFDDVVHHTNLAYSSGTAWAADDAGVDVIDPSADTVTNVRAIETEDPFFGPGSGGNSVTAGGGFGWATDSARGVVYRIDRNGRDVPYDTGLGANGASFRDGVLWARSEDEGTVIGIDTVTGDKTVYRFGHPVGAEVVGGGILLAALGPGRTTEDSIAALKGNVLRLFSKQGALGQGSEPALNWDFAAVQIEFATCAQLLNYPDKPAPEGSHPHPEVAAGMPTLSGDGRTYTFRVRRGYAFSPPSGQPVTAKTFRYSIQRALSPKLGYGPGPFSVSDIQGEQAFRSGKADHISGLRAAGDRLSITLTKPSPGFPYHLADPAFCPVPIGTPFVPGGANRRAGDAGDYSMPSAGPYYVAAWRNEKYVILKRNPNYHGPRPHALNAIVLREGLDATAALDRIRHGGWDGIVSSGHTGAELTDPLLDPNGPVAARYGKTSPSHYQYVAPTMPHVGFLVLNAVQGPFTDRTVRRAAALAVDRAEIARVWGNMVPADQLLPPGDAGFHDRHLYPLRSPALRAAAALMHGRRFDVVMGVSPYDQAFQQGRLVRAELGPIGLRVKLVALPDDLKKLKHILAGGGKVDLVDGGIFNSIDGAEFLETAATCCLAQPWFLTQEVRSEVKGVTRLTGNKRWAAVGRLADRLAAYDVPLIAYGNRVEDEFFAPTVGCRVFPPASYGVDLAALCRKGTG